MDVSEKLPTGRAFLLFIFFEAIAVGLLWVIGLLSPVLVLVFGVVGVSAVFLWDRGHRKSFWAIVLWGFVILGVSVYLKATKPLPHPTVDDLSVSFVPDRIVGRAVTGRLIVENNSADPLHIKAYRLVADGDVEMQLVSAITIAAHKPGTFVISSRNRLADGGRIVFEAHYSFAEWEAEKALYAVFSLEPNTVVDQPISPSECCEKLKSDFRSLDKKDEDTANAPEGTHHAYRIPEFNSMGRPMRVWITYKRREFIFDAKDREVRFKSILRGQWYELKLPLRSTFDGLHDVSFAWHEPNGFMGLTVDKVNQSFDVDTGQVVTKDFTK